MSKRPWPLDAEPKGSEWLLPAPCHISYCLGMGILSQGLGSFVGVQLSPSPHHQHQTAAVRAGSA